MNVWTLFRDEFRFLTFRSVSPAIQTHWRAYLAFGLIFTWLAGIGRYWDNPRAGLWQHLGLGSLAYVFVLGALLWAILSPLRPNSWKYRNVLLFVALTSPPAVLYAIPVERFMSPDAAMAANGWFLEIIAAWRVALLGSFLIRVGGLKPMAALVGTLLPLRLIVITLTVLNLEHVVFNFMGGFRSEDQSSSDIAYEIVMMLSMLSCLALPFLLVGYGLLISSSKASKPLSTTKAPEG